MSLHSWLNCPKVLYSKKWGDILDPSWTDHERDARHQEDLKTLWFSVDKKEAKPFEFEDYDRFATLVSQHRSEYSKPDVFYPRLVSFIGFTGAGKSTLIRTLIERPWLARSSDGQSGDGPKAAVPVIGNISSTLPTSGDVHLYRDPKPPEKDIGTPLFYADCEGFHGGEVPPSGSRAAQRAKDTEGSPRQLLDSIIQSSKKFTLNLPDSMQGSKRESAVTQLFPLLLYNFSDVVVYVVHSGMAKTMEKVMLQLLHWAEKSRAASINQPALPHVVIVLNQTPSSVTWDSQIATRELLKAHANMITENEEVRRLRRKWEKLGSQIDSLEDLLHCSYASVQIIWIPDGRDRSLLSQQVLGLYQSIDKASSAAQEEKRLVGMRLSSQEQQSFFRLAFKHYTQNIDDPFDFIAELLALRPIPNTLSNNILQFLKCLWNATVNWLPAEDFMAKAAPVLSSIIALDRARNIENVPGKLLNIYEGVTIIGANGNQPDQGNTYKLQVKKAITLLCDKSLRCEFVKNHKRCVNFRLGHVKGHQSGDGLGIGTGNFESRFVKELEESWEDKIRPHLESTEESLTKILPYGTVEQKRDAAWSVHSRNLKSLYDKVPGLDTLSISVCFWCLREVPFKVLRCGHGICSPCARSCGHFEDPEDQRLLFIEGCFLHHKGLEFTQVIQLKPHYAGIRMLTLDGGGVRGIIELRILRAIEKELGDGFRIQRFFDLIGGTSTGALIALGLGIKDWTVEDCEAKYKRLCNNAFMERVASAPGSAIAAFAKGGNYLAALSKGSMYKTTPLEMALRQEFGTGVLCSAEVSESK